jgi:hypothetical protein
MLLAPTPSRRETTATDTARSGVRGCFMIRSVEAFEELYCRISALELLVFAMAGQIDRTRFMQELALQKEKLLATATFASLSTEVADRLTATIDRYARVLLQERRE